jgi:hypothetical protein
MTTTFTTANTTAVDRLGEIKAQIADLKRLEDELVAEIKAQAVDTGKCEFDGEWFRATVSVIADRETLDPVAAEKKLRELGVDGRWFSKNQKTIKGYTSVRIAGRKSVR